MPDERSKHPSDIRRLLGDGDPSPVTVINPAGRSPFLLIGDHARNAIPTALGTMGLTTTTDAATSRGTSAPLNSGLNSPERWTRLSSMGIIRDL